MACFLAAVHLFGLTWQLQPVEGQLYENGVSKGNRGTESMDTTYSPIGGKVSDKSEKKGTVIKMIDLLIIDYFSSNLVIRTKAGMVSLHIKFHDHSKEVLCVDRINTCKCLMKANFPFSSALSINQLNFSNM